MNLLPAYRNSETLDGLGAVFEETRYESPSRISLIGLVMWKVSLRCGFRELSFI